MHQLVEMFPKQEIDLVMVAKTVTLTSSDIK